MIVFSTRQQKEFLKLMMKGASPLSACVRMGVLLDSYDLTVECSETFRSRVERMRQALIENVNAAAYRDAMEGKTAAQSLLMRDGDDAQASSANARRAGLEAMSLEELQKLQRRLRGLGDGPSESDL